MKTKAPPKIVIVGCGVVGAMIAYELSSQIHAEIHVIDKSPEHSSTGAALGVLMGVISHKVKGRTWRLREASVQRYRSLIQELGEANQPVPFNTQGIVSLCFNQNKLPKWEKLREKRLSQGWPLEIWSPTELKARCPQIELTAHSLEERTEKSQTKIEENQQVQAAIYSPADGQVHPTKLTQALCTVAAQRGVTFHKGVEVTSLDIEDARCVSVQTTEKQIAADWVILSAGLGSAALTKLAHPSTEKIEDKSKSLELMSVLGQAMEVELPDALGDRTFQPVINGHDIQLVPLENNRYWIGATVEFPQENEPLVAEAQGIETLLKEASRFCPDLSHAKIIRTWSGLRPRPVGQPAPVIQPLAPLQNVTLATGHYRNGVLLAPATAQQVCEQLRLSFPS